MGTPVEAGIVRNNYSKLRYNEDATSLEKANILMKLREALL